MDLLLSIANLIISKRVTKCSTSQEHFVLLQVIPTGMLLLRNERKNGEKTS